MFFSKMMRFFRDTRNAPQFLNENSRGVFTIGLIALMATPGVAFAVYQFVLNAKNLTAAQAGVELPFKIFTVAMAVSLMIGVPLINMLMKGERSVLDLHDLLEGASEQADDPINPANPVLVVAERIRTRLQQDHMRAQRAVNDVGDFEYRWISWSEMPLLRKVGFVVVLTIGFATFAYGVALLAGLVPPKPMPDGIDLTRPNGMMLRNIRSGEADLILGLVLGVLGAVTGFFSTRFFVRTVSKSDEALKRFMKEMGI
ncbi:MAG: hypothetical protein ACYC5G_01055 [Candidatus Doudnabacteria bacterium]